MAFVDATPKILPPRERLEERSVSMAAGLVIYVGTQYRRVYELQVLWQIDDQGGETVPGTYSYGGQTYILVASDPQMGYTDRYGILTAVYERSGAWGSTP